MQVSDGSQSLNAINQLRVLSRWMLMLMLMLTVPYQLSVAKAFMEFDEAGRMRPLAYYDRVVNMMEELVKFTVLTPGVTDQLFDRYSERKKSAAVSMAQVNQRAI